METKQQHPAIQQMLEQLEVIKEKYGETHYKRAAEQAARMLLQQGGEIATVARDVLQGIVDFDALEKEPQTSEASSADQMMMQAIRQQMPGIQTQAQFNIFMAAFDALRMHLNAIFLGNAEGAASAKEALLKALDTAVPITDISQKLGHVPEAAESKEAEEFKQPPKQFHEHDVQRGLMTELELIQTSEQLAQWYTANRARIDEVVSQSYRNILLDAIRAKKASFLPRTEA